MSVVSNLTDHTILIYRFADNNLAKSQKIDSFLKDFSTLCNFQMIDSLDNKYGELEVPKLVLLFLVTNISNFDVLKKIKCPESVIKIVAYFLTEIEFDKVNIPSFRRPLKARLFRLIYPDEFSLSGLIYPSYLKIFDTIYARTIRNKFNAIKMDGEIANHTQQDPRSAIADMKEMGWYFRDMGLNHADSFAGGIAIRFAQGILVTASYTDKYQIESERICYVENYLPEKNQVNFVGNFPPSSESALSYLAFQQFPEANLILHFHYKPMTCAPKLNYYRTDSYSSYGTLNEAEAVVQKFKETGDFAIAYGHGEFVISSDFSYAKNRIDKILTMIS
jgi:ribulose-5-phosphate 4-epimerase/fuculose-1-phosphate aldolase